MQFFFLNRELFFQFPSLFSVLRIHSIFMRIRILDPHWKKIDPDPDPGHFFKIYWILFNKFFSLNFILKLDEPFRNEEIFIISLSFFSQVQIWGFGVKKIFFCSFWLIFYPLDPDPHIFADPDPGSQNLADKTDPDPKHCLFYRDKCSNHIKGENNQFSDYTRISVILAEKKVYRVLLGIGHAF